MQRSFPSIEGVESSEPVTESETGEAGAVRENPVREAGAEHRESAASQLEPIIRDPVSASPDGTSGSSEVVSILENESTGSTNTDQRRSWLQNGENPTGNAPTMNIAPNTSIDINIGLHRVEIQYNIDNTGPNRCFIRTDLPSLHVRCRDRFVVEYSNFPIPIPTGEA